MQCTEGREGGDGEYTANSDGRREEGAVARTEEREEYYLLPQIQYVFV